EEFLALRTSDQRIHTDKLLDLFEIPSWVNAVLALFAIAGFGFAILGLITGVTYTWVGGLAYLMLGLTSGSIAVKLRSHFESAMTETTEHSRGSQRQLESELQEIRENLRELGAEPIRHEATRVLGASAHVAKKENPARIA